MFFELNVPDHEIDRKQQNIANQTYEGIKRELENMIKYEDVWVPKGCNPKSLFMLWKIKNPLSTDPTVFRTVEVKHLVTLPYPELGTHLYEYVKEDRTISLVWSLPERVLLESGAYQYFDWDEISSKSLEDFSNGKLKDYVRMRNKKIKAELCGDSQT